MYNKKIKEEKIKELLQELISEIKELRKENQEIKEQNKTLIEQNQQLIKEINELKAQQTETFKQILEDTIQSQLAKMVEEKFNELLKKADKLYEGEGELAGNQREIVKAIAMVRDEIVKHLKESKESEDKLLAQGEKVLEVLDDIGKSIVKTHDHILDSNSRWGETLLDKFVTIAKMI